MKLEKSSRPAGYQPHQRPVTGPKPRLAQILVETSLERWGCAHGGHHRTLQLHEIMANAGIKVTQAQMPAPASNLSYYFKGIKFLCQTGFAAGCNPRLLRRHGIAVARLAHGLARHTGEKVLFWEYTHRNEQAVPFLARKLGYAVVAAPHNIEALVPNMPPSLSGVNCRHISEEARALEAANSIFTISREEQWFLAFFGLPSFHLPYFPAAKLAAQFFSVRASRRSVKPGRLLILGNAGYLPTRAGMTELIRLLRASPDGASLPVDIAGFGTELFQQLVKDTAYRVHGTVSESGLAELLKNARATLIHQTAGAGALTRIPEMLIAGVPVIANSIAARSHAPLDGLYVYETPAELTELLKRPFAEPELPDRPVAAERRLVDALRECIALTRQANPA